MLTSTVFVILFQLTHRQAVDELFSNITWTFGQADDLNEEEIISHWKHPETNIYINLVIFIIMNVSFLLSVMLPQALVLRVYGIKVEY